jgi:hypothetical protein
VLPGPGLDLTCGRVVVTRVTRHRVGELAPKREQRQDPCGAPPAERRGPSPWSATPLGADVTGDNGIAPHLVTHHFQAQAWAIPEPAGDKVE